MVRQIVFSVFILSLEALVVFHWFFLKESQVLGMMALVAGVIMCFMALGALVLAVGVFRLDPEDPQHRTELKDLAKAEKMWVAMTLAQFAFMGAVWMAGVYWLLVALVIGQGAELAAVLAARIRIRQVSPGLIP